MVHHRQRLRKKKGTCSILTTLLMSPAHNLNTASTPYSETFSDSDLAISSILVLAALKGICLNLNLVHLDCRAGIILET
jgi:hypothetical protein